ncbi:MAG: TonB-dependent receptor, partial [candidate division Zixibacteria bacterium]|nr:TonB-dependent receptor [candidate division Zixibacteria bacterium]
SYRANASKFKLETQSTFRLDSRNSILIGAETEVEKFDSESFFQDAFFTFVDTVAEVSARTSSLYVLNQLSLTNRWFTTIGARYDNMESNDEAFTYRVTSAYLLPEIGLTLKANYGTGFKNPSLFQLFHRLYGNPELKAEESQSWEVGLQKDFGKTGIELGVTYFDTKFKNLIASDPITFLPVNIRTATSNGVELTGRVSTSKTTARFNYTYTNMKNTSDDTPILRRPKSKFSLSAGQQASKDINIGGRVLYVGERNDFDFRPFPAELLSLSRYVVVDVRFDYSVTQSVKLKAGVVNILDQDYQEVLTYGVSGRALNFGAKLTL